MVLTLVVPTENTLHGGDVDDPRRRITLHFTLELADQVEGHDGVDNLCGVAV